MDVLVIGGGVAGVAAALAARAAGAEVLLVRPGPGASALCAGGWRGQVPPAFAHALASAGHPLEATDRPLADCDGELVTCELAPPWHVGAAADPAALVCGIVGLPAFHAPYLARAWGCGAAVALELADTPAGGWSPVALAAALERAPERLGEAVGAAARERGLSRAILPAVLGLEAPADSWRAAARAAGIPLAEALGGWPSVPGWRLDGALLRALAAAGVALRAGRVLGADFIDGRLALIRLQDGEELRPGTVVLATGKFAGGGIVADPTLREAALGLPVWMERLGEHLSEPAPLLTTSLARSGEAGGQPLLAAGVRADAERRPLGPEGRPLAQNVLLAGSVRAGRETSAWGLGDAAADGWAAGLQAAGAPRTPTAGPAGEHAGDTTKGPYRATPGAPDSRAAGAPSSAPPGTSGRERPGTVARGEGSS